MRVPAQVLTGDADRQGMKTKVVFLLAAALVLGTVGAALAAKGKPTKPHKPVKPAPVARPAVPTGFQRELRVLGITCPQATVDLQGSFGGAGDGFMAVVVSRATGRASSLVGKQVSLRLLKSTRIVRNGPTVASRLRAGDRLNVVALMCSQGFIARSVTATAHKS
jgi:hypothetical protein